MFTKDNIKEKIGSAAGEIILIVIGILLASFLDNWNQGVQNNKSIDNNFQRVYEEMEKNIEKTKRQINSLYKKDSLIYLVMNDSVKTKDYVDNFDLAYLIINFHNLVINDRAYQNLIQLDISDQNYKEDLLIRLKNLNVLNETIKENNHRMESFVYEESLPAIARNTKTFGDLTYQGNINDDVVKYFISSSEYKSYVSQYSIIALKNQLRYYQEYLREALKIYHDIGKDYKLTYNPKFKIEYPIAITKGAFFNEILKDTLEIKSQRDSLFIYRKTKKMAALISFAKNHYITNAEDGRYFLTMIADKNSKSKYAIKMCVLSNQFIYRQLK